MSKCHVTASTTTGENTDATRSPAFSTPTTRNLPIMKQYNFDPIVVRAAVGVAAASVLGGALIYASNRRRRLAVPKSGPFPTESLPVGAYDAIIVGGGPSGSTCAYYLAKAGAKVRHLRCTRLIFKSGLRCSDVPSFKSVLNCRVEPVQYFGDMMNMP